MTELEAKASQQNTENLSLMLFCCRVNTPLWSIDDVFVMYWLILFQPIDQPLFIANSYPGIAMLTDSPYSAEFLKIY